MFTINITLGFVENDFVFREGKVIIFVLMQLLVGIPKCDPCFIKAMASFVTTIGRNSSDHGSGDIPIAFTGCFDDYNVTSCVRLVSNS